MKYRGEACFGDSRANEAIIIRAWTLPGSEAVGLRMPRMYCSRKWVLELYVTGLHRRQK